MAIDYKTTKTMENIDWESCHSKLRFKSDRLDILKFSSHSSGITTSCTSSTRSCPKSSFQEFAEARLIRAPDTQCFEVYVELLHKDCIAQR